MFRSRLRSLADFAARKTIWISSFVTLIVALVPVARVFFRIEIDYDEGWNVCNTIAVANHQLLYPVKYGFTDVNYPMLSFYLLAQLHHITHEYLFTARIVSLLSLIGSCLLVAAIIRTLKASRRATCLAGLFCFAVFCADADFYIGMDDPQMLAQFFFLAGLFVYIRNRRSFITLIAAAVLFVLGGFIKQNLVDIPLAVLIDLAIISRPRAVWFGVWGIALTAIGVALNTYAGGPYFLSQLLTPRSYSLFRVLMQFVTVLGPMTFPLMVAIYTGFRLRHDANRRIAFILLGTALLVDVCFSGGNGVSINALFTSLLAISLLVGFFIDGIEKTQSTAGLTFHPYLTYIPVLLFLWLGIPFALSANWPTRHRLSDTLIMQRDFNRNVAWLRSHPGPALCESLLLCAYAQKPYVYDPFNATRLIRLHKLDPTPLIEQIQQHRFAAVQLSDETEDESTRSDRFTTDLLAAIFANYTPVIHDKYVILYEPKSNTQ